MKFEVNKCKNHINISDGVPTVDPRGFRTYGLIAEGVYYLFRFPKLFWHQLWCPDNSTLHKLSLWIEKTYKPISYIEQLKQKRQEQLVITKKKTETLLP